MSLTPTEKKKEFKNLNKSGRHCAYLLEDDSGQIRLVAFDYLVAKLESYEIQMDDGQVRFLIYFQLFSWRWHQHLIGYNKVFKALVLYLSHV